MYATNWNNEQINEMFGTIGQLDSETAFRHANMLEFLSISVLSLLFPCFVRVRVLGGVKTNEGILCDTGLNI